MSRRSCKYYYHGVCTLGYFRKDWSHYLCKFRNLEGQPQCPEFVPKSELRSNILFKTCLCNIDQIHVGNRTFRFDPIAPDWSKFTIVTPLPPGRVTVPVENLALCLFRLYKLESVLPVLNPNIACEVIESYVKEPSLKVKFPFTLKTKWGKVIVLDGETVLCLFNVTLNDFLSFLSHKVTKFKFINCELHPVLNEMIRRISTGKPLYLRDLVCGVNVTHRNLSGLRKIPSTGRLIYHPSIGWLNAVEKAIIDTVIRDKWVCNSKNV